MDAPTGPDRITQFRVDRLDVLVFATRDAAGRAAALAVGEEIVSRQGISTQPTRIIFAAAPSQNEFLHHWTQNPAIDRSRIMALHMDEYLGLPADHPASFRTYLRTHLFEPMNFSADQLHLIAGERVENASNICREYENLLSAAPIDLVCGGIGENGHLAFNDPPVADFRDPRGVKVVDLDHACRRQQVHDGCFATLDDVPTQAITLTIPSLMAARSLSIVVPGPRKAEAVRAALRGPITVACPASILRTHPNARIYLDRESAQFLSDA